VFGCRALASQHAHVVGRLTEAGIGAEI